MKSGLMLMVLRYLASAVLSVTASIFVWATCWFWAALSFTTSDGNLPRWCCWLQTHDAPLDELWIKGRQYINVGNYAWLNNWRNQLMCGIFEPFVPTTMFKYCARVCWLIRNPAYGVGDQLGVDRAGLTRLYHVDGNYKDKIELTLWQTPSGWYLFRVYGMKPLIFGRSLRLHLGWKDGSPTRLMLATHINPFRKSN